MNKNPRRSNMNIPLAVCTIGLGILLPSCEKVDKSPQTISALTNTVEKVESEISNASAGFLALETATIGAPSARAFGQKEMSTQTIALLQQKFQENPACAPTVSRTNGSHFDYYSFEGASCPVRGHLRATTLSPLQKIIDLDLTIDDPDLQKSLHFLSAKVVGTISLPSVRSLSGKFQTSPTNTIYLSFQSSKNTAKLVQAVSISSVEGRLTWTLNQARTSPTIYTRNGVFITEDDYVGELSAWGILFTQLFRESF